MHIDLDPRGRKVVIFGDPRGARVVLRRFLHSGATVTLVTDGPRPEREQWTDTVRYGVRPARTDTAGLLRLIGPAWLIVDVGLAPGLRDRVQELAGHLHVLMMTEEPAAAAGRVTLVGGSPGRTGSLTVDTCTALREADVVVHDRPAPGADLAELAAGAELVDVGPPSYHPVSQAAIADLLVARARAGQSVVRLQGGDPFVLDRGAEEMRSCVAAGVPVHVVPGVSSALSVPAACGIPLTHRGVSKAFTVISGPVPPTPTELDALVRLGSTLVILPGPDSLPRTMAGLSRAGLSPTTPAAVVERDHSAGQRSVLTTAGNLAAEVRRLDLTSPAVLVIGEVVAVAPGFAPAAVAAFAPWRSTPEARAS